MTRVECYEKTCIHHDGMRCMLESITLEDLMCSDFDEDRQKANELRKQEAWIEYANIAIDAWKEGERPWPLSISGGGEHGA